MSAEVWPQFVLIGAAKAGTTALAQMLAAHPELFITDPKEPGFFAGVKQFDKAGYQALFQNAGKRLRGDASTQYSRVHSFPKTIGRLHASVPNVKILYAIREPIERIRSHMEYRLREATAEGTAEEMLARNPDYIEISSYGLQLSAYLERFERSQIHVLRMEDLRSSPEIVLPEIYRFLGVDAGFLQPPVRANVRPSEGSLRPVRVPGLVRRFGRRVPSTWKRWLKLRLRRKVQPGDLEISTPTLARLEEAFRKDFAMLRSLVGPEMDLYGYA